jgi:hypothetical protein
MDPLGLMVDGVAAQVDDGGNYIAVLRRKFERPGKKRLFLLSVIHSVIHRPFPFV